MFKIIKTSAIGTHLLNEKTEVYLKSEVDAAVERLKAENEYLQISLNNKSKEIGRSEHRGNTVDYIYDKCETYGNQLIEQRGEIQQLKSKLEVAKEKGFHD